MLKHRGMILSWSRKIMVPVSPPWELLRRSLGRRIVPFFLEFFTLVYSNFRGPGYLFFYLNFLGAVILSIALVSASAMAMKSESFSCSVVSDS